MWVSGVGGGGGELLLDVENGHLLKGYLHRFKKKKKKNNGGGQREG